MRVRSVYSRALSTAVPARRPSLTASARSACERRRVGLRADQRDRADRVRAAAAIGTMITDLAPIARSSSRCSLSRRVRRQRVGRRSPRTRLRCPVRITSATPAARRAPGGSRGRAARASVEPRRIAWWTATRSISPRSSSTSTAHQSAICGTASRATCCERLGVVERGGQHAAGLGHEALRQLGALDLGDVLEDVDHVGDAVALGVDAPATTRTISQRSSPVARTMLRTSSGCGRLAARTAAVPGMLGELELAARARRARGSAP